MGRQIKKSRALESKTLKNSSQVGSFLMVSKKLLSSFGPEIAIFISNLIDKHEYFKENFPDNEGWFFLVHNQQIEQTGLTLWKIHNCKRIAILNGWIETKLKGSPAKEWYKINLQLLDNQLAIGNPNSSTNCKSVSDLESSQQAIMKPNNKLVGNRIAYKETMNKGDYKEGEEARSSSEELSLSSSSSIKPKQERDENLSDSEIQDKKRKDDRRESNSSMTKEVTSLTEEESKERNTYIKLTDKLFTHINGRSMDINNKQEFQWYIDLKGLVINDNYSVSQLRIAIDFVCSDSFWGRAGVITCVAGFKRNIEKILFRAKGNPIKPESKEEQNYFNSINKARTIRTKEEIERERVLESRSKPN